MKIVALALVGSAVLAAGAWTHAQAGTTSGPAVRLAESPSAFEIRTCVARHADLRTSISGSMRCTMTSDGRLENCTFHRMNPATPQAEAAYRCVASKYRVETVEPGGVVPAGETFTLPIRFRGSVPRTS